MLRDCGLKDDESGEHISFSILLMASYGVFLPDNLNGQSRNWKTDAHL